VAGDTLAWLETTQPERANRLNPEHVTCDGHRAAFWYNPYRGLVRARVERQHTDEATIALYNLVNGTSLRVSDVAWAVGNRPAAP
jgi:hypothetical protein